MGGTFEKAWISGLFHFQINDAVNARCPAKRTPFSRRGRGIGDKHFQATRVRDGECVRFMWQG